MSIIKSLQNYLITFDKMELKPIPQVMTDQTSINPSSYAIAPAGNGKTSTDIIGNRTFENDYIFYAKEAVVDEVDRQDNYDFLETFSDWLDEQNEEGILPSLPAGYTAESLEVSNAMLIEINEDGTGLYQIQIKLTIKRSAI